MLYKKDLKFFRKCKNFERELDYDSVIVQIMPDFKQI
jgi:hypothetical protein